MTVERKTGKDPLPVSVPAEAPDPTNAPAQKFPKVTTPRDAAGKTGFLFGEWGD